MNKWHEVDVNDVQMFLKYLANKMVGEAGTQVDLTAVDAST